MKTTLSHNPRLILHSVALAVLLAGSPAHADGNSTALVKQAIAKAVFQTVRPEATDLSELDLQDLKMVLELKDAKAAFAQGTGIFAFLTAEPVPSFSGKGSADPAVVKRCRILDARKAAAIAWLVEHGAAKECLVAGSTSGENARDKTLGELLGAAAQYSGSQATKAILELAGTQKIPAEFTRQALLGAVRNAWLFPETVKVLLEAGVSCDPDSRQSGDVLLELLKNFTPGEGDANKNTAEAFDMLLKKTTVISPEVMKQAIAAGWAEGVEKFLAVDSKHEAEACLEWLVSARLRNNKYPEVAFTRLKELFTALGAKQAEVVKNLPPIRVYFTGGDPEHGDEPWVTDGTAAGTRMLADVNPGQQGSNAGIFGAASGGLVMLGNTEGGVRRLLSLPAGRPGAITTLVPQMGSSDGFAVADGGLVIWRSGRFLWQTDGTEAGTVRVAAEKLDFSDFMSQNGRIFVKASPHYANGYRGERQTGSTMYEMLASRRQLLPLCRDNENSLGFHASYATCFVGRRVYASNFNKFLVGPRIVSDQAPGQTPEPLDYLLKDQLKVSLQQGAAAQAGDYFYFSGNLQKAVAKNTFTSVYGWELFRTDGTAAGTSLVADIREEVQDRAGSQPDSFFVLGKTLLFQADDGKHGRRLWSFDGDSTRMLHEAAVPLHGAFVALDSKAFFVSGKELWSTDGTPKGTVLVRDFTDGPEGVINAGPCLVFSVGNTLWRSDGTAQGTRKIAAVSLPGVSGRRFFPGKPGNAAPAASADPLPPLEKEEKLPEKKFKPVPLGGG